MRRYPLSMGRIICGREKNERDQGYNGNCTKRVYKRPSPRHFILTSSFSH